MRIILLGDVVGRAGRDAVVRDLPRLRESLKVDFAIVNGENAAAGFGITRKICDELFAAGADVITGGNHSWDQRDIMGQIDAEPRLLRPINFPPGAPGRGSNLYRTVRGKRIHVVNVMLRLYMDPLDDPFQAMDAELNRVRLGAGADVIVVDMHGEASSEKQAIGYFCDGRASMVIGTHTHVPTADARILPGGTAYQTDAGMCGDYESIIGMKRELAIPRFVRKLPGEKLQPAEGEGTVSGVLVDIDDSRGLATAIQPIRLGGVLSQAQPT